MSWKQIYVTATHSHSLFFSFLTLQGADSRKKCRNKKPYLISGNPWPCFDVIQVPTPVPNPNGLTWILEFREQFQDVSSTFCAKHEHNQWSQIVVTQPSSRVSNVTLIDYLNSFHVSIICCVPWLFMTFHVLRSVVVVVFK